MGCGCVSCYRSSPPTAGHRPQPFLASFTDADFVHSLGAEELKDRKLLLVYFRSLHEGRFEVTPQLLDLVRHRGAPLRYRWLIWRTLSGYAAAYQPDVYQRIAQCRPDQKTAEAIAKDLDRTFPHVEDFDDAKKRQLDGMLRAYASLFPQVGYCQGMNFIAGFLLVISGALPEEAFFMLVQLMVKYHANLLFCEGLPLLKLYTFQFQVLLEHLFPEVHHHFVQQNVTPELYVTRWILTGFTSLPFDTAARIWDLVFSDGLQALVLVALANVKLLRPRLLQLQTEGVLELLSLRGHDEPPSGGALICTALGLRRSAFSCGPGLERRLGKLYADWEREFPEDAAVLGRSSMELCDVRAAAPVLSEVASAARRDGLPASTASNEAAGPPEVQGNEDLAAPEVYFLPVCVPEFGREDGTEACLEQADSQAFSRGDTTKVPTPLECPVLGMATLPPQQAARTASLPPTVEEAPTGLVRDDTSPGCPTPTSKDAAADAGSVASIGKGGESPQPFAESAGFEEQPDGGSDGAPLAGESCGDSAHVVHAKDDLRVCRLEAVASSAPWDAGGGSSAFGTRPGNTEALQCGHEPHLLTAAVAQRRMGGAPAALGPVWAGSPWPRQPPVGAAATPQLLQEEATATTSSGDGVHSPRGIESSASSPASAAAGFTAEN